MDGCTGGTGRGNGRGKAVVRYSGWTAYRGGLPFDVPQKNHRILESGILSFRIVNGMVAELWMKDQQEGANLFGRRPGPKGRGALVTPASARPGERPAGTEGIPPG